MERSIPLPIQIRGVEMIALKDLDPPAVVNNQVIDKTDPEYHKPVIVSIPIR